MILGSAFGAVSPAAVHSPTLYLEVRVPQGTRFTLPDGYTERAAYVVAGSVRCADTLYREGTMAIARPGATVDLTAIGDATLMIIGGEPVGPRHIWWNFVASSQERIEQGKRDWRDGRFARVPGDDEFIPLPD